jgi:hypothetical protein
MASLILTQVVVALAIGLLIVLTQADGVRQAAKARISGARHRKARNGLVR